MQGRVCNPGGTNFHHPAPVHGGAALWVPIIQQHMSWPGEGPGWPHNRLPHSYILFSVHSLSPGDLVLSCHFQIYS